MRILIVDDNEENLVMLKSLLNSHGYEVIMAENGVEALEKALQKPPNMVISDILMPKMDGFSLCREWKQKTSLKDIPFIIYTATYTDSKDREFALSLGAERFILKPAEPDSFIKEINEILDEQQKGQITKNISADLNDQSYLKTHNERLIEKLQEKIEALEKEVNERKQVEEKLQQTIQEKQQLLTELYHRTYNNMQVIHSMIKLQAMELNTPEVDYLVSCTENRIQTMSLVQNMLQNSKDLSYINLDEYLQKLSVLLAAKFKKDTQSINIKINTKSIPLLIDSAIPFGLLINELLSGSFERPESRKENAISIELNRLENNTISLTYSDPLQAKLSKTRLNTINALGKQQLQGSIKYDLDKGIFFFISFPAELYHKRL